MILASVARNPRTLAGLAAALALLAGGCGSTGSPSSPGGGGGGGGGTPAGYGVPQLGYPGWRERALLVLTNAVRLSPVAYRDRYAADFSPSLPAAGALAGYPAVGPLRWNLALNQSARAHSTDMGVNGCFQHASCDGTAWNTRIASYYGLSGTLGENIAAGYPGPSDPRYAMSMWLCDASGGVCCADHASCDGHRANMMSGAYRALGTGYAHVTASYQNYWTQDFGGATDAPAVPVVDGSHVFFPAGQVTFLVNHVDDAAPRSVTLVLAGSDVTMALDLGTATAGTWAATVTAGTACRSYHFVAVDAAGVSWRYPASGELRTYGEGSCVEDWVP
jgi:hypothetical protein